MSSILNETQSFDNEIPFCVVSSQRDKKELEHIFLKNRISYYVDWQNQSIWQRLFGGGHASDRINCQIRINRADIERAYELVKDMKGLKFKEVIGNTEKRAVTKRALMDEISEADDDEQ